MNSTTHFDILFGIVVLQLDHCPTFYDHSEGLLCGRPRGQACQISSHKDYCKSNFFLVNHVVSSQSAHDTFAHSFAKPLSTPNNIHGHSMDGYPRPGFTPLQCCPAHRSFSGTSPSSLRTLWYQWYARVGHVLPRSLY